MQQAIKNIEMLQTKPKTVQEIEAESPHRRNVSTLPPIANKKELTGPVKNLQDMESFVQTIVSDPNEIKSQRVKKVKGKKK